MHKCKCINILNDSFYDGMRYKILKNEIYQYEYSFIKEDRGYGDYVEIEYYTIYTLEGDFIITTTYNIFTYHFMDLFEWRKEKIKKLLCKS